MEMLNRIEVISANQDEYFNVNIKDESIRHGNSSFIEESKVTKDTSKLLSAKKAYHNLTSGE